MLFRSVCSSRNGLSFYNMYMLAVSTASPFTLFLVIVGFLLSGIPFTLAGLASHNDQQISYRFIPVLAVMLTLPLPTVHLSHMWCIHVHCACHPVQLMRPGMCRNTSSTSGDCLTSTCTVGLSRSQPRKLWFSILV